MYRAFVKPFLDRLVALIILVISAPVFLPVMFALAVTNRGTVWFIQSRPGYQEKPFNILKFRTMTNDKDASGSLLPDHLRTTNVGKLIRKFSLDELPQLINVLMGEMSVVGPRPLLMEYLPRYNTQQKKRHDVRPGITGWAQVNGRNAITWVERFEYDAWYVDHVSFSLDLKILWKTLINVVRAEGINSSKEETMEKFRGNPD